MNTMKAYICPKYGPAEVLQLVEYPCPSPKADEVLDYAKDESISQLEVYDLVLDAVGKRRTSKLKEACKRSLAAKGRYVSIDDGALDLNSERLARITELVESKAIVPVNDRCYNFEQMIEAHRYVELGHKQGNVAITVNTKEQ